MIAFTPFRYIFHVLRTCICTNYCVSCLSARPTACLPCMRLDHDLGQVMKFVYMRTTCSVTLLNMRLKLELKLLKQKVFIVLSLYLICVEYEFEAFDATSDEIRLMAFYLNPNIIVISLKTCLSTSDEIRIITKVLCLNCTENEIQT